MTGMMRVSSVFISRNLATHFAGSQYCTRGSLIPAVTSMCKGDRVNQMAVEQ